jgi:lipoate-protein ligase A
MERWRFLNTGLLDGAMNMAVDEALLLGLARGTTPPTVRVFGWRPPTVSAGYSQDLSRELDLEACRRAGFGVVRRPTGGRAVLHAGELTYSVVGASGEPPLGSSILETYRAIAEALLASLAELGVNAELAEVGGGARAREPGAAPPCFASAGRLEVVVGGRKLIGSAQRRSGDAVLQHGSLLLDGTHAAIADVLRIPDAARRLALRRMLGERTTNLAAILGRTVEFAEVARAVAGGFRGAWRLDLTEAGLTQTESQSARRLATRYATGG